MNAYLAKTTGLPCPVKQTSSAVFNLFLRRHKKRHPEKYPDLSTTAGMNAFLEEQQRIQQQQQSIQQEQQKQHQPPEEHSLGLQPPKANHSSSGPSDVVPPQSEAVTVSPLSSAAPTPRETSLSNRNDPRETANGKDIGDVSADQPLNSKLADPTMTSSHKSAASSNPGEPIESMFAALIPFVQSVCEMEENLLTAGSKRKSRERMLQTYTSGLGDNASGLLVALKNLNSCLKEILASPISSTPPPSRSAKVQLQGQMQQLLQKMRSAKEAFEDALNQINCLGDEDEDAGEEEDQDENSGGGGVKEQLYALCDQLYSRLVVPRCSVAEVILSVKVALAIRTEEVLLFAQGGIEAMFEWDFVAEGLSAATNDAMIDESRTFAHDTHRQGLMEVPNSSLEMLVATLGLAGCFAFRPKGPRQQRSTYRVTTENTLAQQCLSVSSLCRSLTNVEQWIREAVDGQFDLVQATGGQGVEPLPDFSSSAKGGKKDGSSELSRSKFGSSKNGTTGGTSASSSALRQTNSSSNLTRSSSRSALRREVESPPPEPEGPAKVTPSSSVEDIISALVHYSDLVAHGSNDQSGMASNTSTSLGQTAMRQNNSDLNNLIDVIGTVNIWLRRNGLHKETPSDSSTTTGKTAVTVNNGGLSSTNGGGSGGGSSSSLFLDHQCNDLIGWPKERSDTYSEACLRAQLAREQISVCQRLLELATETENDEFYRICHEEDMLVGLLADADNCCVLNECRRIVERRIGTLMVVKVKAFHHSGEVRAVTISQKAKLKDMLEELQIHFIDAKECKITHTDEDGDKVSLSTNQEWQDLVRMRRITHLIEGISSQQQSGGASMRGTMTSGLGASTVGAGSVGAGVGGGVANTMKMDLFFDKPPVVKRTESMSGGTPGKKLSYVGSRGHPTGTRGTGGGQPSSGNALSTPEKLKDGLDSSFGRATVSDGERTPTGRGRGGGYSPSGKYEQQQSPSRPGRVASANSMKDLHARMAANNQLQQELGGLNNSTSQGSHGGQSIPPPPSHGTPNKVRSAPSFETEASSPTSPQVNPHFAQALNQMEKQAHRHLGSAPPLNTGGARSSGVPPPPAHPGVGGVSASSPSAVTGKSPVKSKIPIIRAPPSLPPQPAPGVAPGGPEQVVVYVKDQPGGGRSQEIHQHQPQRVPGGYRPTSQPTYQFEQAPQQQQQAPQASGVPGSVLSAQVRGGSGGRVLGGGGGAPGAWGRPGGGGGGGAPAQWGKPSGGLSGGQDFAKHSMSTVALSDGDSDEDGDDGKPRWNRGTDDHVSAVLNSGDAQAHLRMLRHNGPYRRAGRKA